jgi:uncharacterized repeat protein (TIGR01451 family)
VGLVTVDDPSAAGFTVTGLAGTGWTCAGTQCTRSDALAAGAAFPDIIVTVSVANNASSPLVNTGTVSGGVDVNPTNNSATDSVALAGFPDLAINKSHSGNFVRGQIGATFSLTVSNVGNAPTPGTVTVTDTLPAGLTATAMGGTGWTCTVSPLSCTRSDALSVGASYPVITLTVDVAANAGSPLTNSAHVSVPGDSNPANDTATDTVTVNTGPDLALVKTHTGSFLRGQSGNFTLTVTNLGDVATTGTVNVTDTLPAGLSASTISGTGWTCTVTPLACSRTDALAPAASYPVITLTVLVASNASSPLVNSATVSTSGDSNPANDTGTDSVSTLSGPDLTIAKTHTGSFIRGQVGATFTLAVSNVGDLPSSGGVTVVDTLPTGLTATGFSGTGWTCTLTPLSCTRSDSLVTGASYPVITLTVNVANDAAGILTNTATVAGGGDTYPGNNTATDPTTVATGPDLKITKTHTGSFTRGQVGALFTVVVANQGGSPTAGQVSVVDILPSGLTAAAIAGTGWTCTVATLTCARLDVLAPATSYPAITVTVNVASDAPLSLTNVVNVTGGGAPPTSANTGSDVVTVGGGVIQVPALSQWALILLVLLMMGAAGLSVRRRC